MIDPKGVLETIYASVQESDGNLPAKQQAWVAAIIAHAESQKAVLAVLITSLTKKIVSPEQDVRQHKVDLPSGYSGRVFDTQHVTPFIRSVFPRLAMKSGSGWLLPLKSHTTSDGKSRSIGDIEISREDGRFFEAVEVKLDIPITRTLVADAFEKIQTLTVERYYLLTTANPNTLEDRAIEQFIAEVRATHGCEIIVNGVLPTLKYYLRLLDEPATFVDSYEGMLLHDYAISTDIKSAHVEAFQQLVQEFVGESS